MRTFVDVVVPIHRCKNQRIASARHDVDVARPDLISSIRLRVCVFKQGEMDLLPLPPAKHRRVDLFLLDFTGIRWTRRNRLHGLLCRGCFYRFLGLLRARDKDDRKGKYYYLAGHNGGV